MYMTSFVMKCYKIIKICKLVPVIGLNLRVLTYSDSYVRVGMILPALFTVDVVIVAQVPGTNF